MGYRTIPSAMIEAGRVTSMSLFMLARNNFTRHESRIVDLEASPAIFPTAATLLYAGSSAPTGFLLCDGTVVSRTTYADLFAIVGTSFNTGGEAGTDFRLPDYRGRSAIGVGAGALLTSRSMGDTGGLETHLLTTAEMALHTHALTDPGHTHKLPTQINDSGAGTLDFSNGTFASGSPTSGLTTASGVSGLSLAAIGDGGSHNNMQPSTVLNFIIKT